MCLIQAALARAPARLPRWPRTHTPGHKRRVLWLGGANPRAVRVDRFLVASCGVVLFLVLEFVEQQAMNPHRLGLRDTALPYPFERFVEVGSRTPRHYFVDERDVLARRKDQREFLVGSLEHVVYGVERPVDDLDVLHAL
jgi:hypothetical protein